MQFTPIVKDDIKRYFSKQKPDKWFIFITIVARVGEGTRLVHKMNIPMLSDDPSKCLFEYKGETLWAYDPVIFYIETDFTTYDECWQYIRDEWDDEKGNAYAAIWKDGECHSDKT